MRTSWRQSDTLVHDIGRSQNDKRIEKAIYGGRSEDTAIKDTLKSL